MNALPTLAMALSGDLVISVKPAPACTCAAPAGPAAALKRSSAVLARAAAMPLGWLRAIPVAAGLFIAGRVLFARGYRKGAAGRAMGFGLTMYSTAALLATLIAVLCYRALAWIILC